MEKKKPSKKDTMEILNEQLNNSDVGLVLYTMLIAINDIQIKLDKLSKQTGGNDES